MATLESFFVIRSQLIHILCCFFFAQTRAVVNLFIADQVMVTNLTYMQLFSVILLVLHTEVRRLGDCWEQLAIYRICAVSSQSLR